MELYGIQVECNGLLWNAMDVMLFPLNFSRMILIECLEGVLCANICAENVSSFLLLVTICVLENMRWILPTPAISEKMTLFDNDPDDDF